MYKIQTLNAISEVIHQYLGADNYTIAADEPAPDGILVRSASMHDMELPEDLLAIARAGAGTNNIPIDKCTEKGIVVFNTPGANANAVAELVICGLMLGSRNVVGGIEWARTLDGKGDEVAKLTEKGKAQFVGPEVRGKTLGVVGLGAIGALVANGAIGLGMNVIGYDPFISVDSAWSLSRSVKHCTSMDEIYAQADYITFHIPLLKDTRGSINAEAIAKMKDGVIILNFARDSLVDDEAMAEALKSGKVSRYVTDFPNAKTANMPGCIAIPHLGASTEESEDNCAKMAVQQMMDYLENGNIKNSVNFPNCDMGICRTAGRITILHKNIPNSLSQFTAAISGEGINIAGLVNKSRGDYAYTMLDLDHPASDALMEHMKSLEGVLRVRRIR